MDFHPLAELFPLIEGASFDDLVADIRANGLQDPIVTYEGKILDGRNRWRACEAAGVTAVTREYTGTDPLVYVVSHNLHRRHLDESQRAMVASRIANLPHGGAKYLNITDASIDASSLEQKDAAHMLNVSRISVQRARKVITHAAPELIAAVDAGKVAVSVAAQATALPVAAQVEIATAPERGQKPSAVMADLKSHLQSPTKVSPQKPEVTPARKLGPPCDGMQYAWLAVNQLEQIKPDDTKRMEAFRYVQNWITEHSD